MQCIYSVEWSSLVEEIFAEVKIIKFVLVRGSYWMFFSSGVLGIGCWICAVVGFQELGVPLSYSFGVFFIIFLYGF